MVDGENVNYETWWDENVVSGNYSSMDKFRTILDRNKSRYDIIEIIKDFGCKNVLDVGCGLGLDYEMYKLFGVEIDYHGVDACDGFIKENIKKNPDIDFRVARAQELPFEDGSFDIVTSRGMLEHLKEPEEAIAEMARVSKKYVILIWFLLPQKKEIICLHKNGYYRNIYSVDRIRKCLDDNGLTYKYNKVVKDKVSPMKRHEIWVMEKI